MTAHTCKTITKGCYRCELNEDEVDAATAEMRFEHGVMEEVLEDLDRAVRMGGLAGDPFTLGFVWAQNQDALLAGTTTWEAQYGPHRKNRLTRENTDG